MGSPASEPSAATRPLFTARVGATAALFLLAALQFGWNAAAQPGFWGYDEGAHAAVAFGIAETGELPHPLSGWSTFHPPLNALLGAGVLGLVGDAPGRVALFGLRLSSMLGALLLGGALFALVQSRFGFGMAWVATALALFLPVTQLAASMVGNEALGAGLGAMALLYLVALQRDPGDTRRALLAGLFAGLACATKFTGCWVLALAVLPFLHPGGTRAWRSFALCVAAALFVAGPFYLRNVVTTGTPIPMTRNLQPMKHFEARMEYRPREIADYVTIPWSCGQYPYITVLSESGAMLGVNPAMQNVPCMLYTGLWFDPFGIRGARTDGTSGVGWGLLLLLAGVAPTLLVGLGLLRAVSEVARTGGRAEETPMVVLVGLGLASFVGFTWIAPSLSAAKASYLLPLVVPAGYFFASGASAFPLRARRWIAVVCAGSALLAAVVFTTGVVFPSADAEASRVYWTRIGSVMPEAHIVEAMARLIDRP